MADFGILVLLPLGVVVLIGSLIATVISLRALSRSGPETRRMARIRAGAAVSLLALAIVLWVALGPSLLAGR